VTFCGQKLIKTDVTVFDTVDALLVVAVGFLISVKVRKLRDHLSSVAVICIKLSLIVCSNFVLALWN